jgi:hypothetical protein
MAKPIVDTFRKAALDAGITGKNWRKIEAFDDFSRFFNETYTEPQRQAMKYDEVLKIGRTWWEEHHSKYS